MGKNDKIRAEIAAEFNSVLAWRVIFGIIVGIIIGIFIFAIGLEVVELIKEGC